jgi:bacterioferritin-associated ferredoxin
MGTIRIRVRPVIICICHRVSDRDIAREASSGCPDFSTLQDELRVGTGCGACLDHAQMAFDEHVSERACGGCAGAARCGGVALANA